MLWSGGCYANSKLQETLEQIEFDLGMLDESIDRYSHGIACSWDHVMESKF